MATPKANVEKLKAKRDGLMDSIRKLEAELGESDVAQAEDIHKHHIELMHKYNETKDAALVFLGQWASLEGKTVTDIYHKLGVQLDD